MSKLKKASGLEIVCVRCHYKQPIEAGLADADGKMLAGLFARHSRDLSAAILRYFFLFKPLQSELSNARAYKIALELEEMINANSVSYKLKTAATIEQDWISGLEKMRANPPTDLPLTSHMYLIKIVLGNAQKRAESEALQARDQLDREQRARETALRAGGAVEPTGASPRYEPTVADRQAAAAAFARLQAEFGT